MAIEEEDLDILGRKLGQLRLAYDQYFLGNRPREPVMLRDEVRKLVVTYSNQAIQNTAMRFKFNSICSRYQAFNRQWADTLRKIEQGTYHRHRFKADLHEANRQAGPPEPTERPAQDRDTIYEAYVEARQACGQSTENLTPAKLNTILDQQLANLRTQFGDTDIQFKVVVEQGKAKLKASKGA